MEKKERTDHKGRADLLQARVDELESRLAEIDKDTGAIIELVTKSMEAAEMLDGESARIVGDPLIRLATRAELLNIHIQGKDELEFWRDREGI